MDPHRQPENPTNQNRRENQIQGPRPSPLKVSKDSHKITKKPPIPPKNTSIIQPQQPQLPATGNQPVIIYSISPKPIFVDPSNFRSIVQHLTGKNSEPSNFSGDPPVSPAARFASIERTSPSGRERREKIDDDAFFEMIINNNNDELGVNNNQISNNNDTNYSSNNVSVSQNPGILSPSPANLPAISSAMFSPIENQLGLGLGFGGFGGELIMSPLMSNLSFLQSPSSNWFLSSSAPIVSPSPSSLNDFFTLFD